MRYAQIGILNSKAKPAVSDFGTIINQDFSSISNLNNYTIVNPQSTWAISNGKLESVCTAAGGFANYAYYNAYGTSILDRWTQTFPAFEFVLDGGAIGISIGGKSLNTRAPSDDYQIFVAMYAGGVGQITMFEGGVTTGVNNLTGIAGALSTDTWTLTISRVFDTLPVYTASLTNIRLNITRSVTFSLITGMSTTWLTNTGMAWAIYNNGGTIKIPSWSVASTAKKNVSIGFIGNSIWELFNQNAYANAIPAQAMLGNSRTYTKFCSQSSYSQIFWDARAEIAAGNCDLYVMGGIADNDKQFSISDAICDANLNNLADYLKTNVPGCTIIWCAQTPRNTFDMNPVNTRIRNIAISRSELYVPETFTTLLGSGYNLLAAYNSDNTHITQAGGAAAGLALKPYLL